MALNFVTVTGTYQDETGKGVTGFVDFTPSAPVVNSSLHVTIAPQELSFTLSATGQFSAQLLAMDNLNLSAFVWVFRPSIINVPMDPQYLSVLFANGATQDITVIPSAANPFG